MGSFGKRCCSSSGSCSRRGSPGGQSPQRSLGGGRAPRSASASPPPPLPLPGHVGQTEPHKTLGHVFTLAQKAPRLSYPLLSSLRGHPAVRQTLPGAQDCAHVTDVPKPRPSSGSGCCCCCCCLSMTQGGTMASSSIPQVCRAPVEPSPCSRRCRLCRGSLRWPGAGPELGELGASSITPARTHRATSFLR